MVICYEVRKASLAAADQAGEEADEFWDQEKAKSDAVEHFYRHLEKVLVTPIRKELIIHSLVILLTRSLVWHDTCNKNQHRDHHYRY